jgi:hypothetical protein
MTRAQIERLKIKIKRLRYLAARDYPPTGTCPEYDALAQELSKAEKQLRKHRAKLLRKTQPNRK